MHMRVAIAVAFAVALCAGAHARAQEKTTKSEADFYHPGVLVNRAQLEFVKAKVAAGAEPWKSAFEAAKSSPLGAISYTPTPRQTVECGPYSKPDLGCKDEQRTAPPPTRRRCSGSSAATRRTRKTRSRS